jgi:hypothetical protein
VRLRPHRLANAAILAAALSATACTSSSADGRVDHPPAGDAATTPAVDRAGGRTFSDEGVSFSYPRRWRPLDLTDSSASTGSQVWSRTFGVDGRNIATVAAYELGTSITEANIDARSPAIREQLDSLFAQAGGALETGPTVAEMGGLPALSFTGTARNPSGHTVHSRLILAFDGTTEYFVNCQYDDGGRDEMLSACDRLVSTFTVTP